METQSQLPALKGCEMDDAFFLKRKTIRKQPGQGRLKMQGAGGKKSWVQVPRPTKITSPLTCHQNLPCKSLPCLFSVLGHCPKNPEIRCCHLKGAGKVHGPRPAHSIYLQGDAPNTSQLRSFSKEPCHRGSSRPAHLTSTGTKRAEGFQGQAVLRCHRNWN